MRQEMFNEKANSMCIKRVGMNTVVEPAQQAAPVNSRLTKSITNAINAAKNYGMQVDIMPLRLGKFLWEDNKYVCDADFNINITCDAPLTMGSIAWNGDVYLYCNRGDKIEILLIIHLKKYGTLEDTTNLEKQ